ncbi:SRPBCC domain-containing protein [Rhodoferax sp. GW822-FHT02A01]|uniref:SRPBCC family protein n=1 Tax=Rhodoferax sp. GW822-FHT02A01 TaxID=3141537 RepID=UPI00315C8B07
MSTPFKIQRLLKAPRQLVWDVYSQAQHLPHWFGPKGSTMPFCDLDFRVGGTFHYSMKTAEGMELWGKWLIREIVEPEKIALIQCFSDPQGNVTRNPWTSTWPLYTHSVTTLQEQGDSTLLTIEWAAHEATAEEQAMFDASHASMTQGWSGNLDVLESYLALLQTP